MINIAPSIISMMWLQNAIYVEAVFREDGVICGGVWCEVPGASAVYQDKQLRGLLGGTVWRYKFPFFLCGNIQFGIIILLGLCAPNTPQTL